MENQKEAVSRENQQSKPKQKQKRGKIAQVYKLHQKGVSVKEIAEKMKLSERVVRAYIWRMKNPGKFKALVQRYFLKKKQEEENTTIKAAVKNQNQNSEKKKES